MGGHSLCRDKERDVGSEGDLWLRWCVCSDELG